MNGINNVTLLGNLVKRPELRKTNSGIAVTDLRLAINSRVKSGTEWRDDVLFLDVTVWRGTAEAACKLLDKGSVVGVVGRITERTQKSKDGREFKVLQIVADRLSFAGRPNGAGAEPVATEPGDESDVPF